MVDVIKCSVCGENNLADQEFCQYCRSRLVPLTGALQGADAPIKPGQVPTKKNTAELEPILPQWLRDARDSARKSAENELTPEEKQKQESFSASTSSFDLLAGLQTQKGKSDEEAEIPDWLANLTGDSPKQKKEQPESSEVRWVELGGKNDFPPEETNEIESNEKDDLSDWFRDASTSQAPIQPEQPSLSSSDSINVPPSQPDTPDWLRQMVEDSKQKDKTQPLDPDDAPAFSDTPDWLRNLSAENDMQASTTKDAGDVFDAASASLGEEPDWLRALGGSQDQTQSAESAGSSEAGPGKFEAAEGSSTDELPDWMQNLPPESEKPKQATVPKWLQEESSASSAEAEIPAWLSSDLPASESAAAETEQAPASDESFGDIPSWLRAAAPQSSIYLDSPEEQVSTPPSSDTPDWLGTSSDSPKPQSAPAFAAEEPIDSSQPAFTPDAQASYNMDALFTDMPDWLSKATDSSSSLSPSIPASDSITPGELPSWVQAMRPVGSGDSSSFSSDETLETRGALAGLQGVLPAVPGYAATSKPKTYSIRLQVNEEQQTHAGYLEQILAAETAPIPIAVFSSLQKSRGLRWVIAFIFFAILTPVLFMGTQFFSMPVGSSREIDSAIQVVQSIPEGAPVLVAIDYEPALSGEMEAVAAPIFDMLQNPRLTFISTNVTGGILAERFISGPLAGFSGEGEIQPLNLGYLPGGQMGIRAFGQNPPATAPFDVSLALAWTSPQLEGITSLSQFAALIIVTDSADSARAWIEQTSATRGAIPVVVISSAQAAPMIQPYYESQQVSGLVAGLYGGAVVEQKNGSISGGTARGYWDAYSIGMLLAMVFILGGGLLNLALGLSDRAAAREAK